MPGRRRRRRERRTAIVRRPLAAGEQEWDRPRGEGVWTLRQVTENVGSAWYAEQLGELSR